MSVAWQRVREPAIVLGLTIFIGLLSTSQRWAGLDTPDSSFYASLGLFGSEVTDRAPIDSYYWTRLGSIAPVHALTSIFGPWAGFLAWRMLLVLAITGAFYVALRKFTGIASAAFLTAIATLSSVILSYLGNTYLTGAALAGTAVAMSAALFAGRRAAFVAGVALGWLVMVNPVGALMAGTLWLVLRVHCTLTPETSPHTTPPSLNVQSLRATRRWSAQRLYVQRRGGVRGLLNSALFAALAAVLTFATFWLIGRVMFPGLDWLGTYLESNNRIDYSDFASKDAIWLRDISLIIPVIVLLVVVVAWLTHRTEAPAQRALVISLTSIAFMLVFSPLMGGIPLEGPFYQAMLWPPAMLALALVTSLALPDGKWTAAQVIVGLAGIATVIIAGHVDPNLGLGAGWLLAIALVIVFLIASYKRTMGALIGLALLLGGAQLIQNSRDDLGLYYLSPYNWAFAQNPISDRLHTAVNTQEWLLGKTTRDDSILTWVDGQWVNGDRELYVVAGMQLWGENRATLEPTLTDPDGLARLATYRPDVIAMYGQSMDSVLRFWQSLPPQNHATAPDCYDFTWAPNPASAFTITEGHACVTRLNWGDQ